MSIDFAAKCEIHAVILRLVAKEKSSPEIFNETKTVYGEEHQNRTSVYNWCKQYKMAKRMCMTILTDELVTKKKNRECGP